MNKEDFLDNALNANKEAVSKAKLSDMINGESSFYTDKNTVVPKTPFPQTPKLSTQPEDLPTIRTFTGDISTAVEGDNLSLSHIVTSETTRTHTIEHTEDTPQKKTSFVFIICLTFALMLTIGGIGAIGYTVFQKRNLLNTPVTTPTIVPAILRADSEHVIEIKNPSARIIGEEIAKELKNPPTTDGLRKITLLALDDLEQKPILLNDFIKVLEFKIPDNLARTIDQEYFLGINFIRGEGKIVLILKGENPEQLFPGMLEWETYLEQDLRKIFLSNTGTSTGMFKDKIIANKDTRTLSTEDSSLLFFYSIIDEIFVIYAEEANTFTEMIKRIREQNLLK